MGAASDLYHELTAHGLTLAAEEGTLLVSPRELISDDLRARIRESKADLLALLAGNVAPEPAPAPVPEPGPTPAPTPVAPHRCWLVTLADGGYLEITSTAPCTEEEIKQGHPEAVAIEPDPPEERPAWLLALTAPPNPDDTTMALVSCSACRHWTPNWLNPDGGLGRCLMGADASRRPGSLWPSGTILCPEHEPVGGEV